MGRTVFLLLSGIVAILAAAPASAAVVTFDGFLYSESINIRYQDGNSVVHNSQEWAGALNIAIDGTPFIAYCVDLDNGNPPQWNAIFQPVSTINAGIQIAWLYDTYAAGINNNNDSAALQVAMWELLVDHPNAIDLTTLKFQINDATPNSHLTPIKTKANQYLASIPGDLSSYVPQSFVVHSTDVPASQHLIVPEPTALAGLLIGTLLLRRRIAP